MNIAVIVPTYNRYEITKACVDNLLGSQLVGMIVISDSNSSDLTPTLVAKSERIKFLNVGENQWWSGAVNAGIGYALKHGAEQLIILNDDLIFDSTLVDKLSAKSKIYPQVMLSASQNTKNGIYMGAKYSGILKKCLPLLASEEFKRDLEVDISNGCCLLIPAYIFSEVGLMNEQSCPHLYGDTEFQIRARNKGFKILACADILINQLPNTNYLEKLNLKNIFTGKGSPFLITAYIAYSKALYGTYPKLIIFGFFSHLRFMRAAGNALLHICYKNINLLKEHRFK